MSESLAETDPGRNKGQFDTGDGIRSRHWDLYQGGKPSASLDVLLGALGASGTPVTHQQEVLRDWLASPAAIPAPPALLTAVRKFLDIASG